ncbi:MAG: hypothetical protein HPY83_15965 [Anaerolineae bacterium]|nr:hypothetical protein [Anaerolineae bacterium]
MESDVRVLEVETSFTRCRARSPIKFGAVVMDSAVLFEARVTVENGRGRRGSGWGSMFLADLWAFPSAAVGHEEAERAMVELSRRCAALLANYHGSGHPLDIAREVEPGFHELAENLSAEWGLAEPLPALATLVSASPLDAALHDAFGLANGVDTYRTYGPAFMSHDLAHYLGPGHEGLYPEHFLRRSFAPKVPVFHLVGGLDRLTRSELRGTEPDDGLPNSLEQWIEREGLYCLKVKLRGNDLVWDVERLLAVDRVAQEVLRAHGRQEHYLTADTNEVCDTPDYAIEMLARVREASADTARRILYVEQPTQRDLWRFPHDMHGLAKIVPVLADESLYDDELFDRALELGWSGPALKACKGQSHTVLWLAKAEHLGLPYSIQDLTNPGLALLQSVGLAARSHPLMGVEYNSRQYFPDTSPDVQAAHPDAFHVRGGEVRTESLRGPGLGFCMDQVRRQFAV